jgi:hypothetical protein
VELEQKRKNLMIEERDIKEELLRIKKAKLIVLQEYRTKIVDDRLTAIEVKVVQIEEEIKQLEMELSEINRNIEMHKDGLNNSLREIKS